MLYHTVIKQDTLSISVFVESIGIKKSDFKHSNRMTYRPLDGWIRMRLRSILRRRQGRRGHGRGRDHTRWTNAYFRQRGLFSLDDAYVEQCQSLRSNC